MEWLSVREWLPRHGSHVIATNGRYTKEAYLWDNDEWKVYSGVSWVRAFFMPVTHWMPMPKPPKEEDAIDDEKDYRIKVTNWVDPW